ncbi:MAG: glycerate kinase, partial [Ginsengibacter sp.]
SIDDQTLQGKGPFGVASRAKQFGLPVIGIAGKVPVGKNESLMKYFDVLMSINEEPFNLETALMKTESNLVATSTKIGDMIAKGEIVFSK